ncbi:NAD(P)H-binding protein [Caballeronia sp. dw_276]|uniref:NAD(P)H-binding protein n=1 Tax=Caballeronia sp. dw_276 TaxID=2719795 RepID=UPI001BD42BA7|nr:NAD(P)H-binding protein [Caballeronia sp. dw_276]
MKLLLLGATGLVGRETLKLALSNDVLSEVIAPTRQPLAPNDRLVNPVGESLEKLVPNLMSYRPDAIICALGTTQAKAGSKEAFRYVDYELPVAIGKVAHAAGVARYAIVTAMGASTGSMSFYYRTKGEVERDIQTIGFPSLSICRPSLIDGERNEKRGAEHAALTLLRVLAPVLPRRFRVNPADAIAASLIDAVITGQAGCRWIYSEEIS